MLVCYAVAISAEATYYYSDSKKIPLYENPSKVIVRSHKGYHQAIQKTSSFQPIRTISCDGYELTLVEKKEDISIESIKTSMLSNNPQRIVYPCYRNENGDDVIPTLYILLSLKLPLITKNSST